MTTLKITDFPPEIIALIADWVNGGRDLASMSLASHLLRIGVLLSQRWVVVTEILAATGDDVKEQRRLLHDRRSCAEYACAKGLVRALRALDLSRDEVVADSCKLLVFYAARHGQLEVLKYLHSTYALTSDEISSGNLAHSSPLYLAAGGGHLEFFKYLHTTVGMEVSRDVLNIACYYGRLEILQYLHTEVGLTAEDVRLLQLKPLRWAGEHPACIEYLKTGFELTSHDAWQAIGNLPHQEFGMILEIFDEE
eukprot:TRINITY_DN2166_c8_g1_i1.p1 TRINITY_DN2166_c8_g1~~TRINITY_DN2166_c8_g1_i1.p1  ORF type:complete len:252 (+),score=40.57 TRINITY_DN2166_c8_g1_i1:341-1096(+)